MILKNGNWETTEEYKEKFLGEDATFVPTGKSEFNPDGTGHTDFWGIFNTTGGTSGRYKGNGNIT